MSEVDRVLIDASVAMVKALSKISDLEAEIARLRAHVDPPERVSEQGHVGCSCPTAWKPPHDPKCPTHGRVSEASALREALEEIVARVQATEWDTDGALDRVVTIARRALEDTKGDG